MKWLASLLLCAPLSLHAQVRPQPGQGDPRLQIVQYDADQIVHLPVVTGFQVMVALATGEQIGTIAVGDSAAWQVTPSKRGDFFFVKNMNAYAATNMVVVTNIRTYNFDLVPSSGDGSYTPYNVRFIYAPTQPETATAVSSETHSYGYKISGAKSIRPTRIFQSGNQTLIEWGAEQSMPAIFAMENGAEILINGEMLGSQYVITGFPEKLVFRMDKHKAVATRFVQKATTNDK